MRRAGLEDRNNFPLDELKAVGVRVSDWRFSITVFLS